MKKNQTFALTVLIGLALLGSYSGQPLSASVIPINNGDFDAAGSSAFTGTDPNGIVGWTVTQFGSGDVGVIAASYNGFPSADGNGVFLYQGTDASPIILSQTLTGYSLTPGSTYNLTLDVGKRATGTAETLTVNLFAGSTELTWSSTGSNQIPSGPASPQLWSFTYVAPTIPVSGDLKIELVGGGSGNNSDWIAADNVTLTNVPLSAAPEPSAYALLIGSLGLIVALRLRKMNSSSL